MKSKNSVRSVSVARLISLPRALWRGGLENVLQVSRFAAETRAVVNDLAVNFSRCVVDKGHKAFTPGGVIGKGCRCLRQ